MKKFKLDGYDNLYIAFGIAFILVASIFAILIKYNLNKILEYNIGEIKEINTIFLLTISLIVILLIMLMLYILLLRREVVQFSNKMCEIIDRIISKEENVIFNTDKETILSKLQNKLKQLLDIIEEQNNQYLNEKNNIKSLIADISHQIKTPITNISIYNETLIERELNKEQQKLCLYNMKFQVSKLEWLVQALIKMSRLENNIISLNKSESYLGDTIANALNGIVLKAEKKNIRVQVNYPEDLKIVHDKKWTSEALFNIFDNAVKYTANGGHIDISVEKWDIFSKIDIKDTGIGIVEADYHNIFKRFYRCTDVSEIEGVGIGLFLTNEIITKQGGYIKVSSKKGEGTIFSVFMPN